MPQFSYHAVTAAGARVKGITDANSPQDLQLALRAKGLFCTTAEEYKVVDEQSKASIKKIPTKPLSVFIRQFATLITSGVTVIKGLDVLYLQAEDKNLKNIIGRIYEGVQRGEQLSEAFRKQKVAFPDILVNMIEAGEASGTLDTVMNRMAGHFEKESKLQNKVKGAMTYPIVLASVAVVVVAVLLVFVLPTFTNMITGAGGEVPFTTKILIGISDIVRNFWYLIIGFGAAAVFLWRSFLRSEKGRLWFDTLKFKIPIIKKSLTMIYCARFCRTMSSLLLSGIQMLAAIEISSRIVGNRLLSDQLLAAREDIKKGITLSMSFKKISVLPPMVHSMVSIGEESGMLDSVLDKTAAFYDEESDAAIQRMVGMLEPLMIVIMAIIVGFIVISIALPMFSMYGAIGG
jgi:type IV pilus assembly protein PilC